MATYYVDDAGIEKLLRGQRGKSTFAPVKTARLAWVDPVNGETDLADLGEPRSAQSPKGLFLPAAESVGRYGRSTAAATAARADTAVVLGIRACGLRALKYLDQVMLAGDFQDAEYRARREGMLLISCDCVDCTDSCFCTLVGGRPYATDGYEVNLTPLEHGCVAEAATERGQEFLETAGIQRTPAGKDQLAERDRIRAEMTDRLKRQNERFAFVSDDQTQPGLPHEGDAAWQEFAADCVECGACTNICPTCHCFYLYDQILGAEAFERVRTWDSCLLSTYHRMAGGANLKLSARPRLYSRLANRVLHKFTYSPQQYGLLGCVGCGRCVDACLGAIDIREVVGKLQRSSQTTPAGGREASA